MPASPATQQHTHKGKNNRRILSKKLFPSMVVLVLVDPREGSDGDIYGTKSLFRVSILVLVGGEKYI